MRGSRLVSILMVLQARGRTSARALAERLEVSIRTVYRDIDELCAAGVPIVVERGAAGGFELLAGWRTSLTGLTPSESQSLFLAGLPGPVAELGLGDTLASAQLKVLAALPREWQAEAERVRERVHVDLVGWYRRATTPPLLRPLAEALWADRRVRISYASWQGVVVREVEPLGLVIKASEWYLVAAPAGDRRRRPRTYRVASVRALEVGAAFARPARFDLATTWAESTGRFEREIYRDVARVRLTGPGRRALARDSAAAEAAVAAAIAVATVDGAPPADTAWLAVDLPIESVEQATRLVLALGADAVVIAPVALRDRVCAEAAAVAAHYRRPRAARGRGARGGRSGVSS